MCVFDYKTDRLIGQFDAKGYMEVEESALCGRMAQQFKAIKQRKKRAAKADGRGSE